MKCKCPNFELKILLYCKSKYFSASLLKPLNKFYILSMDQWVNLNLPSDLDDNRTYFVTPLRGIAIEFGRGGHGGENFINSIIFS